MVSLESLTVSLSILPISAVIKILSRRSCQFISTFSLVFVAHGRYDLSALSRPSFAISQVSIDVSGWHDERLKCLRLALNFLVRRYFFLFFHVSLVQQLFNWIFWINFILPDNICTVLWRMLSLQVSSFGYKISLCFLSSWLSLSRWSRPLLTYTLSMPHLHRQCCGIWMYYFNIVVVTRTFYSSNSTSSLSCILFRHGFSLTFFVKWSYPRQLSVTYSWLISPSRIVSHLIVLIYNLLPSIRSWRDNRFSFLISLRGKRAGIISCDPTQLRYFLFEVWVWFER